MNITHFKLDDGSPLTATPDFKIVLEWLAPFISDFSEDEFWAWLDKFYEKALPKNKFKNLEMRSIQIILMIQIKILIGFFG